jgi:hypothetical protein
LFFLLNTACLSEKYQKHMLQSLVWPDRSSNPRYTSLEASMLIITSHMLFHVAYICNCNPTDNFWTQDHIFSERWLFNATEYLRHKWKQIYYLCRNYNPVLSSFITFLYKKRRVAQQVPYVDQELHYPSGEPEVTPGF